MTSGFFGTLLVSNELFAHAKGRASKVTCLDKTGTFIDNGAEIALDILYCTAWELRGQQNLDPTSRPPLTLSPW